MSELSESVRRSLHPDTRVEFDRRVTRQAAAQIDDVGAGRLDTGAFAVGLELEGYAVDAAGGLATVPDDVFETAGCGKELGVHNFELNTAATQLTPDGLRQQLTDLGERLERLREALGAHDRRPVLDALWTAPPAMGSRRYFGSVDEDEEVLVARQMRTDYRYHALDNETLRRADGRIRLSAPGVDHTFPTILVESLATSMQPHLQIPDAEAFPRFFNTAIRTLGPVLALSSNSPFLPADLYEDHTGEAAHEVVAETPHELRVRVFEESINVGCRAGAEKVRVPTDVDSLAEAVLRLVGDETFAPDLTDPDEADYGSYPNPYPELAHKRGTYWRWVRAVIGGQVPVGAAGDPADLHASIRLEYRPLPTQPTVTDTTAVFALVVGLLRGLVAADHPLHTLPWEAARDCFYDVVDDGLDADLAWVTADGEHTADPDVVFAELFEYARRGLAESGLDDDEIDGYLAPVERRWARRRTPSGWKKAVVAEELDAGSTLPDAIVEMQRRYVDRATNDVAFDEWGWPGSDADADSPPAGDST